MAQTRWNIQARLPEGSSRDQVPEMMQALLAERFKMTAHCEKRSQSVYALVVAKGGAKLDPAVASAEAAPQESDAVAIGFGIPGLSPPGAGPGRGAAPPDGGGRDGRGGPFVSIGGTRISRGENCGMKLEFDQMTIQRLADTLTPFLDKPVVDATQLKGAYKIAMELPMEVMFSMMQNMARASGFPLPGQGGGPGFAAGRGDGRGFPPGGRAGGPLAGCDPAALATGDIDTSSAAIFQAVQKMGLRLQASRSPVETIVVDRLERAPTEN